jgi:hypothetical protein
VLALDGETWLSKYIKNVRSILILYGLIMLKQKWSILILHRLTTGSRRKLCNNSGST